MTLLIASLCYALQIYTDFSGCVDIARGAAQAFGIDLPHNFNQPYLATSIQDFWRRWHMSLSSWLRDYVYIPLGGNRKGVARKYVNIMIVFFVSGLWHGVGLHYIVWGLMHGAYQVAGALLRRPRAWVTARLGMGPDSSPQNQRFHRFLQGLITFGLVNLAWIFFRADTLTVALRFVWRMIKTFNPWVLVDGSLLALGLDGYDLAVLLLGVAALFAVALLQRRFNLRERLTVQPLPVRWGVYLGGILIVVLMGIYGVGYDASAFIYGAF